MKDDTLYIDQILDSIRKIKAYISERAIHNYFDIDLKVVWDTSAEDIPFLERELRKIAQ